MVQTATTEPSRAADERQCLENKGRALAVNLVEDGNQVRVFDRNRERIMAMSRPTRWNAVYSDFVDDAARASGRRFRPERSAPWSFAELWGKLGDGMKKAA